MVDFDRRRLLSGGNGRFRPSATDFGWYQLREKEEEGEPGLWRCSLDPALSLTGNFFAHAIRRPQAISSLHAYRSIPAYRTELSSLCRYDMVWRTLAKRYYHWTEPGNLGPGGTTVGLGGATTADHGRFVVSVHTGVPNSARYDVSSPRTGRNRPRATDRASEEQHQTLGFSSPSSTDTARNRLPMVEIDCYRLTAVDDDRNDRYRSISGGNRVKTMPIGGIAR
ncbi:hypothetical protein BHE74_00019121 [Ensete ventricosum]|nr:hypothetical protein BHE74_00019121 [Ensete ventricosum]